MGRNHVGSWLVLLLGVGGCGDSGSTFRDAAPRSDGPPPRLLDAGGTPDGDTTEIPDTAANDAAADGPDGPDAPDVPDAPATLDASGESEPSFCALQQGAEAGVQHLCYDFGDPSSAADFVPEAGLWTVENGSYDVVAPDGQVTCPGGDGSMMTASVLSNLSAKDVRVHAKLTSVRAPDKVLVLRSRPGGNRIELNFRANFVFEGVAQGGDLYVSALVDCTPLAYVPVGTILIPHAIGQSIVVDVELVGQHLTVAVDGKTVFASALSLPTEPGSVGFATFREAVTQFDDLSVDVLD